MGGLAVLSGSGRVLHRYPGVMGELLEDAARRGVVLENVDLRGEDLRGLNLSGLRAPEALLDDADLSETRLIGANLAYAHLERTIMDGVDLSFANTHGAFLCPSSWEGMIQPDGSKWVDEDDDEHCPECGEERYIWYDFCPSCGTAL